jgi:hypothetical protein
VGKLRRLFGKGEPPSTPTAPPVWPQRPPTSGPSSPPPQRPPSQYADAATDGIPNALRLRPWNYGAGAHDDDTEGYGFEHPNGKPWPAGGCNARTYPELGVLVLPVFGVGHRPQEASRADFDPGRPVLLVPEPDNPHDPKAISVRSADGRHLAGYIKATTTARVRRILKADDLRVMTLSGRREGPNRTALKLVFWRDGRLEGAPPGIPVHPPLG